jgi:hypothetical protein
MQRADASRRVHASRSRDPSPTRAPFARRAWGGAASPVGRRSMRRSVCSHAHALESRIAHAARSLLTRQSECLRDRVDARLRRHRLFAAQPRASADPGHLACHNGIQIVRRTRVDPRNRRLFALQREPKRRSPALRRTTNARHV